MVRTCDGHLIIRGDNEELAIDCILLMRAFNNLKSNNKDGYNAMTETVRFLLKNDDTTRESVASFIQNLSDIL